jgi:predicted metal-dependent hydrolase
MVGEHRASSQAQVSAKVEVHQSTQGVISITPTRRDLIFDLPQDRRTDWLNHCAPVTHLFSTLSIITPAVERYIIQVLREHRDMLDVAASQQLDGLVAQEAVHSREHRRYNMGLKRAGLPVETVEGWWEALLKLTKGRFRPKWFRLATVLMFEHHTAAMASKLLRHPQLLDGAAPGYREMWIWHSLEELEHKSVSFDVWTCSVSSRWRHYALRTLTWLVISPPFWTFFWGSLAYILWAGRREKNAAHDYWQLWKLLFGRHGIVSSNAWAWITYFNPHHHPWNDDNSAELQVAMVELVARYQQSTLPNEQ